MPKIITRNPNVTPTAFKQHYVVTSGIKKKEVGMLKLPGIKKLIDISIHRGVNSVELDFKKANPILKAEAQRKGVSLEEYMKNVTVVYTHRFRKDRSDPEYWYSDAVPFELNCVCQIGEMLKRNTRSDMAIVIDSKTGRPMGYTFVRLNLNKEFFKNTFGVTVEEYNRERNKHPNNLTYEGKIDEKYESRLTDLLDKKVATEKQNGTFKNPEQTMLDLANSLGFNFKFLAEKGYYFDKKSNWFKKKEL